MITKSDWDKLTPQQQWDQYCLLVSECGDSDEVDDSDEETHRLSADELLAVPPLPFIDEPHIGFNISANTAILLGSTTWVWDTVDATSPQYHQQFNQYGNTRLSGE